jgi:hypothetical protein
MNLMKMIDSSLPLVTHTYMGHTHSQTFYTFHHKTGHEGWLLRTMLEVRIKLDKMIKDLLFFPKLL